MIRIEHLKKQYPDVTPLNDVSVNINDGDVISIIGPSGTGKSTLLRCINLLEKPSSGHIYINDEEITAKNCDVSRISQNIGMVFQNFNLFDHLTVIENIMLSPMKLKGISAQEAYDEGLKLLRTVGLAEKVFSYPDELSGGQKQRIAIARALAMNPEIIMFDEPTSALDPTMVGEVEAVIKELSKTGKTMIVVTHEMNFARSISNRIFYMDEGGILEDGSPEEIFDNPKHPKTRRFVQNLKVLSLEIKSRNYDFLNMATQIEIYCSKNEIPPMLEKRILLSFEETVQLLIDKMDKINIQAVCEYSKNDNETGWTIAYSGPQLDITNQDDNLSLKLLKGITEEIHYSFLKDQLLVNQLYLKVKKD